MNRTCFALECFEPALPGHAVCASHLKKLEAETPTMRTSASQMKEVLRALDHQNGFGDLNLFSIEVLADLFDAKLIVTNAGDRGNIRITRLGRSWY